MICSLQCTDCGVPETIGYLKYICRVYQGEDISADMEEMNRVCQELVQKYESESSASLGEPPVRIGRIC